MDTKPVSVPPTMKTTTRHEISLGSINFLSGTAGGVAQVLVGHPFDTLKVRLQTQSGQFKGAFDCLSKIIRTEGVTGLYKGVSSPILGIGFCNAILFSTNGFFRDMLTVEGKGLSIQRITIAGGLAGAVMSLANCPIELLKVRLQVQDSSQPRLYGSIFECAHKTFSTQGIQGLYRGYTSTLARDVPSFACYFFFYEAMRSFLRSPDGSLRTTDLLLAGGIAGLGAWLPCYPQDAIKSRMQASSIYKSNLECAAAIYREAGLRAFFRGFGPTMARAFPANAATFVAYELVRSKLTSV